MESVIEKSTIKIIFAGALCSLGLLLSTSLYAQEEEVCSWTTGADFYSSFVWRGTRLGSGPAIQPVIEFSSGAFTAGAWGSFDFNDYQEVDLYISIALPAGFSIGITDYYTPGLRYFDYSASSGSHAFEITLDFSGGNMDASANCVINEAGGAGSSGGDLYFEAGYSFKLLRLFAGAGNGWHTYDPDTEESVFAVCNLGLEVSKTISVTEHFSIPVTGQLVLNPHSEQMFIVAGFSF